MKETRYVTCMKSQRVSRRRKIAIFGATTCERFYGILGDQTISLLEEDWDKLLLRFVFAWSYLLDGFKTWASLLDPSICICSQSGAVSRVSGARFPETAYVFRTQPRPSGLKLSRWRDPGLQISLIRDWSAWDVAT
jgi:hypothetical protein